MEFVPNYHGIVIARVFLGVCETGLFPAATYFFITWYCRFEVQARISIFYSAASFDGAFSGFLVYSINYMDGVAGLEGWQWIFILEGIITVVFGISCLKLLPDSPATARFLDRSQRNFLVSRLQLDSGSKNGVVWIAEPFKWRYLRSAFKDWKVWLPVAGAWGNNISVYSFIYTAPTVIVEIGYSAAHAQLISMGNLGGAIGSNIYLAQQKPHYWLGYRI
jgi:hypothetical protein